MKDLSKSTKIALLLFTIFLLISIIMAIVGFFDSSMMNRSQITQPITQPANDFSGF